MIKELDNFIIESDIKLDYQLKFCIDFRQN